MLYTTVFQTFPLTKNRSRYSWQINLDVFFCRDSPYPWDQTRFDRMDSTRCDGCHWKKNDTTVGIVFGSGTCHPRQETKNTRTWFLKGLNISCLCLTTFYVLAAKKTRFSWTNIGLEKKLHTCFPLNRVPLNGILTLHHFHAMSLCSKILWFHFEFKGVAQAWVLNLNM